MKTPKNLIVLLLSLPVLLLGQTEYSYSPGFTCGNYEAGSGDGIRSAILSISGNTVVFRTYKINNTANCNTGSSFGDFQSTGTLILRESNSCNASPKKSVTFDANDTYIELSYTLPSNFTSGSKDYYLTINSPQANFCFYAGPITITASTPECPDLTVSNLTLDKSIYYPGETVEISSTVENIGDAPTNRSSMIRYYLSENAVFNNQPQIPNTNKTVYNLSEGLSRNQSSSFRIAENAPSEENIYLLARADADGEIMECHEDNNKSHITFDVQATPGSALRLNTDMLVNPNPTAMGTRTIFSFEVENTSAGYWYGDFVLQILDVNQNRIDDIRFFNNQTIIPYGTISLEAISGSFAQTTGTYYIELLYSDETVNDWTTVDDFIYNNPRQFSAADNAPNIEISISTSGTYQIGCNADITWSSTNVGAAVSIELVDALSYELQAIIADPTTNSGNFPWTIGENQNGSYPHNLANGNYRIKMYETGTYGNAFYSNIFTVSTPSIDINIPNGNATYVIGNNLVVDINTNDVCGRYTAQVIDGTNQVVYTIFDDETYSTPIPWTIPNHLEAGDYKVKVYKTVASGQSPVLDYSDAFFTIIEDSEAALQLASCLPGSALVPIGGLLNPFSFIVENNGGQDYTGTLAVGIFQAGNIETLQNLFTTPNITIPKGGATYNITIPSINLSNDLLEGDYKIIVAHTTNEGDTFLDAGVCTPITILDEISTNFYAVEIATDIPPTLTYTDCMTAPNSIEQESSINASVFINNIGSNTWEGDLFIFVEKTIGNPIPKLLFSATNVVLQANHNTPYQFNTWDDGAEQDTLMRPTGSYRIYTIFTNSANGNGPGDADFVQAGSCNIGIKPSPYSDGSTHYHHFTLTEPNEISICNITNPTPSEEEIYVATEYLCSEGIIDNPNNGDTDPFGNISRGALAKILFKGLFGSGQVNTTASSFPTPFFDLQDTGAFYYHSAKALSYLEYNNGIEVFERDFMNFNPDAPIERRWLAKALLETFDVPIQTNGNTVVGHLNPGEAGYDYVYTACNLGLMSCNIPSNTLAQRYEAFIMLWRFLSQCSTCTVPTPSNVDFHIPNNITPENMGRGLGFRDANFNHHTRTSFTIPGIKLPLVFEHMYNSYATELPQQLYAEYERPLSYGWSHSYHCYIQKIEHPTMSMYNRLLVFWPGHNLHSYDLNTMQAETEGVYDDLVFNNNVITIKKKNQIIYSFERISNTSDVWVLTSITDRNNNQVKLHYENYSGAKKRLLRIEGTSGKSLYFHYQHSSNEALITSVSDPEQREVSFHYDANENLQWYQDPAQKTTTYLYGEDEELRLLYNIELPKGNSINNQYEDRKLQSTSTNNQTIQNDYAWNANGANSTVSVPVVNSNLEVSQQQNLLGNSLVATVKTSTGTVLHTSSQEYNDPNHPRLATKIVTNNDEVNYTYDNRGNILSMSLPLGVTHQFTYTDKNDVETYTDAEDNTTTFGYDAIGNLRTITDALGHTTAIDYWTSGLVKKMTNPEDIPTRYFYDNHGNLERVLAPLGIEMSMTYDYLGRLKTQTDPNGNVSTSHYEIDDLVDKVENAKEAISDYIYDDNNNLLEIKNVNGQTTYMTYDFDHDWLKTQSFGGKTDEFDYYPDGRLMTHTDPNQHTDTYLYDAQGRLTDDGYAIYEYYPAPDNELHKVIRKDDANKVVVFTYDALNRAKTITDYYGNTITYGYDNNSNITSIQYPDEKTVTYEYDEVNRLDMVIDWNNKETDYQYLDDGRLDKTILANGTFTQYYYDTAGRMTGLGNFKNPTDTINFYTYVLDPVGNHLQVHQKEPYSPYTWNNNTQIGTYDDFNHIQSFGSSDYFDDDNGNIEEISGDNNYNFTWDTEDQLTGISGDYNAIFDYDALGHRRQAIRGSSTTRFVLDILGMSKVLMETDENNNPQYHYIHGLGQIARIDAHGNYQYYHYDYRGSTIAITNDNQDITHQYQYGPYGKVLQTTETDFNPYRYVGGFGVQQENEDIYFMRARYYDVQSKRFISEDPIWAENLFGYAGGNPITSYDPKGTYPQTPYAQNMSYDLSNHSFSGAHSKQEKPFFADGLRDFGEELGTYSEIVGVFSDLTDNKLDGKILGRYSLYTSIGSNTINLGLDLYEPVMNEDWSRVRYLSEQYLSASTFDILSFVAPPPIAIAAQPLKSISHNVNVIRYYGIKGLNEHGDWVWKTSQDVGNSIESAFEWHFNLSQKVGNSIGSGIESFFTLPWHK